MRFDHLHLPDMVSILLLCALSVVGCGTSNTRQPDPVQAEFEAVFEDYFGILNRAQLSLDATQLTEVAVGDLLASHTNRIDYFRNNPGYVVIEETRLVDLHIVSMTDEEAVVKVRYEYRQFALDIETSQRDYGPSDRWRWRLEEFTLVKTDANWKVSDSRFIDWSG